MANDLIKILLAAEISDSSVESIKNQLNKIQTESKPINININSTDAVKSIKDIEGVTTKINATNIKTWENANNEVYKYTQTLKNLEKGLTIVDTYMKNDKGGFDFSGRTVNDKSVEMTYKAMQQSHTEALKMNKAMDDLIAKNRQMAKDAAWKQYFQGMTETSKEIKQLNQYYSQLADGGMEKAYEQAIKLNNEFDKLEQVTKKNLLLDTDKMSNRYKNLISGDDVTNIKSMINSLKFDDPNLGKNIDLIKLKMKEVSTGAENSRKSLDLANKSSMSFGEAMKQAAYKFGIWSAVTASYYKVIREISKGVKFVTEMDSALTEIGMVTNQTREQTAGLAKEYNNLAKEMKVLTSEVTSGAVEFYRQGLSQEEVMERLKVTTMYSKVANVDFKQSAELLTATVNSMGVSIERAADVFLFLGDATATSGEEIGKGFSKTSGAAAALGVEFEKVASWIAVISSKTRESAESIGFSINTMLSRMSRITTTGFDEEDGTKINDVAKALSTVGVALMDEQGNFRNFGKILDEVALKFDSLSDKNKSFLANTLAGTRQQSRFFNLMNGYAESITLYEQSLDSASTAQSKFNIYLESNRATLDNFRTTIEGLWITIVDSDSLMNIVRGVTDFIETLDALIQKFGVTNTVLNTIIPLIGIKLVWAIRSAYIEMIKLQATGSMTAFMPTSQAIGNLVKQFLGFKVAAEGATIATTGLTMATVGLTAGLIAIPMIVNAIATAEAKRKKAMEETLEVFQRQKDISSNMDDLIKSYEELSNKTELTSEESQKLLDIKTKIKDLLPNSASAIDNENLSLNEQVLILKDLNEEELKNAKLKASDSLLKYGNNLDHYKQQLENTTKSLDNMNKKLSALQLKQASGTDLTSAEADEMEFLIDWIQKYNEQKDDTEAKIKLIENSYDILNNTLDKVKKKNDSLGDSVDDNVDAFLLWNKQIEENNKLFEDTTSKIQEYNKFLSELNSKEGLSAQSKQSIIQQHKELLPHLSNEKELRKQLIKIISEEEKVQRQAYANMLMYSEDFFNAKILGNTKLVEELNKAYGIELQNFKSLAEAKQVVENNLISNLSKQWAKYYNAQTQSYQFTEDQWNKMSAGQRKEWMDYRDQTMSASKRFEGIALELGGINFKGINMSGVKDSKDKKDSRQFLESIDAEIRAIKLKNDALLSTEKSLQEQLKLAKDIEGIEGLNEQYRITGEIIEHNKVMLESFKKEQDLVHARANAIRDANKKYDTTNWFDSQGEQTTIYIEKYNKATKSQQEEMSKLFSQVQALKKAWMESKNEIEKVADSTKILVLEQDKLIAQQKELERTEFIKYQNALYEEQQKRLQSLESIQEKIVQIIRKRGEEEKKALDEAYNKDMEQLDERHKERKEKYAEDLDAFKKLIQGKIDALDEQYENEDYLEQLNKEREEANRLQKEIDVLSLDDSLTARNKTIELRQQLADQNEKIAKLQQKKERDTLKKSLQDQLKSTENNAKEKEKIADNQYNNDKKRLEEDYKINKEFLERKYSDEKVYAEAKESIMRGQVEVAEGMFEDIYDAFEDFEDKFGKGMGILGDIIKNDFLDQLKEAQRAIEELDYLSSNKRPKYDSDYQPSDKELSKDKDKGSSGGTTMSKSDYDKYVNYKQIYDMAKGAGNKSAMDAAKSGASSIRSKYGISSDKYSYDDLKNKSYKDVKFKHGGKITQTGTVSEVQFDGTRTNPEWIFNDSQLKNIVKDTILSTFKIALPRIPSIAGVGGSGGNQYQILFDVKGNLDKSLMPDIQRMITSTIEKVEFQNVKNQNKLGSFRKIK